MRAVGLLARFALIALVLPVSVHAQVIQGRVLHVSSGDPVRDASVVLLEGEQIRRGTLTELDGSFLIEAPMSRQHDGARVVAVDGRIARQQRRQIFGGALGDSLRHDHVTLGEERRCELSGCLVVEA